MRKWELPAWDWGQLVWMFGIEYSDYENNPNVDSEEKLGEKFKKELEALHSRVWDTENCFPGNEKELSKQDKKRILILKRFCRKLGRRNITCSSTAFTGIGNIEDDDTFLVWFIHLYAWFWD